MTLTNIWQGNPSVIPNPDAKETDNSYKIDTNVFSKSANAMKLISQAIACNTIGTAENA
jgi:hypothetical protein